MFDPSITGRPFESAWARGDARSPHPGSRARHHRWLTLPSTAVVVICIFLPTLRVCGEATAPVEWPIFWTPYVIAALVFAAALVRWRDVAGLAIAIRVILGVTLVGFGLPALAEFQLARFEAVQLIPLASVPILITTIVLPARTPESMVARCGAVAGAISAAWFAMLATDKDAMIGAYLSLGAAIAMAAGCVWWWVETRPPARATFGPA
jgi:hypothetical protein